MSLFDILILIYMLKQIKFIKDLIVCKLSNTLLWFKGIVKFLFFTKKLKNISLEVEKTKLVFFLFIWAM